MASETDNRRVHDNEAVYGQRTVALASLKCEVLSDLVERDRLDIHSLDDADRIIVAVRDHAQITKLWQRLTFRFPFPLQ